MKDILTGLGLGAGSGIAITICVILYFDKISLFVATILKPLSFLKTIRKKRYALRLQSSINSICQNLSPELFRKPLRVKWLKKGEIDRAFSRDTGEEIIVHIVHERNPNKAVVSVLEEYASTSFIPNLRSTLDRSFIVANQLYIMSTVVKRKKDDALSVYYNDYLRDSSDDETTGLIQTIYEIDKNRLYFPCFLNALVCVNEKVEHQHYVLDDTVQEEATNLTNFFHAIATKKVDEEAELIFKGPLFKVSVILVAKKETLNVAGLHAHIDRIEQVMKQDVDRIYLRGIGRENVTNVKRLAARLKKFNCLNGLIETYSIEAVSGKTLPTAVGVYENYYYKRAALEKSQSEEIIDLLNAYIPEVKDGSIEVLEVAREKGVTTKVLVRTNFDYINVIGCCMGAKFERRKSIESALLGESIYFVEYSDDEETLVRRSLLPFREDRIRECQIRSKDKTAIVVVEEGRGGAAIGKLGTNVKLASRLINWRIEILDPSQKGQGKKQA